MKTRLALFWEMFKIALCVVGGGFAILAVADERFSRRLGWTKEGEIVAHLPVFQMAPGIIAGSTAIYVGRKIAGRSGAFFALAGTILPSIIVFSVVSAGYAWIPSGNGVLEAVFSGLRAALSGVIFAMVAKTWTKCVSGAFGYAALALSLAAIGPLSLNPALVVAMAAAAGIAAGFAPCAKDGSAGKRFVSSLWAFPLVFLKYGSIAFGGGYVLVPAYIRDFVGASAPYLQLAEREFADVMALTQATPGPISVNCATFFGYRLGLETCGTPLAGVAFATVATLCLLVPGSILLYAALGSLEKFSESRIVKGFLSGVRPVTVAMMLNALWAFLAMTVWTSNGDGGVSWHPTALVLVAVSAVCFLYRLAGVVVTMFACAAASAAVFFIAPA